MSRERDKKSHMEKKRGVSSRFEPHVRSIFLWCSIIFFRVDTKQSNTKTTESSSFLCGVREKNSLSLSLFFWTLVCFVFCAFETTSSSYKKRARVERREETRAAAAPPPSLFSFETREAIVYLVGAEDEGKRRRLLYVVQSSDDSAI